MDAIIHPHPIHNSIAFDKIFYMYIGSKIIAISFQPDGKYKFDRSKTSVIIPMPVLDYVGELAEEKHMNFTAYLIVPYLNCSFILFELKLSSGFIFIQFRDNGQTKLDTLR